MVQKQIRFTIYTGRPKILYPLSFAKYILTITILVTFEFCHRPTQPNPTEHNPNQELGRLYYCLIPYFETSCSSFSQTVTLLDHFKII